MFYFAAQENTTTIVFRMFDKILAPELVPSILDKFIKPYLCEHNLQKDELLLQYIKVHFFFFILNKPIETWVSSKQIW